MLIIFSVLSVVFVFLLFVLVFECLIVCLIEFVVIMLNDMGILYLREICVRFLLYLFVIKLKCGVLLWIIVFSVMMVLNDFFLVNFLVIIGNL